MQVCKAASKTFSLTYSRVHYKGAEGVMKMQFARLLMAPDYYRGVTVQIFRNFKRKHGKSYTTVLKNALVSDFGKPLKSLIKYLVKDHRAFCAPTSLSGGLGMLPFDYRFKNGVKQEE